MQGGGFLGKAAFGLAVLSEGILTGRQAKPRSPAGKGSCAQENQYRGAFPSSFPPGAPRRWIAYHRAAWGTESQGGSFCP